MQVRKNQFLPTFATVLVWLAIVVSVILPYQAMSQCTLMAPVSIPDNGILEIDFSVTGLIDANLSSPTQGICGVDIDFMHEYLGDLTITLISPAGTMVQLIGPPTTAISPTNLSRWNIDFVPCGTPPAPDAGFTPTWNNLQAWQALTPYTGTYHPASGCLEDFNTGPANGVWRVIIQDHDQFQLGSIAALTLIFCNPTGLVCSECSANAGVMAPTVFNICSGENIQSSDIMIDFGGNTPVPALYGYEYLLVVGNTILQSGASFSITPPAGNYQICGLSYLLSDAATINALIAVGDYSTLSQAISDGLVCADLTSSCIALNVSAKPDTVFVSGSICNGEVYAFGGQNYTTDGIFYQTHDGPGLCDTVFEIHVAPRSLTVTIGLPDTLTCALGSVGMSAVVSGASGPFGYQWTTIAGNITSPSSGNAITVDQAGQYFLQVTDGICDGTGSATVIADQGYPQIFFEGGTLSCDQPSIDIHPIYIPTNGTVLWNGPGGFVSAQPDITITVPGTYIMNVTNANGCTTSRSVDIGIDTMTNPLGIYILAKDCQSGTATLADAASGQLRGWSWTGPNMFVSNYWRPVVSDPGLYTLTATFLNGCTRSGTILFDGDFVVPDLMVSPEDTLNCNEIITLTAASSTPGVMYTWNGPQGFYSTDASVQVSQQGMYAATVVAPNGCRNGNTVNIVLGDDIFDFQLYADTITCLRPSVSVGVISAEADVYQWINYPGPDADQPEILVSAGGNYYVQMTDTNTGCVVTGEVFVPTDIGLPPFSYTTDTITCLAPVATLQFVPTVGVTYTSVHWELPDLTVIPGPTAMSSLSGQHLLVVTGENGCESIRSVYIPFDTITPFVILETDTLICRDTVQIISQSLDSIIMYQWSGPGIISPNDKQIDVNRAGWYHLDAFGLNGCPTPLDILVDSNFVLPVYTLTADTLRCDRPAELQVEPGVSIMSYKWFDPIGQLISTDSFVQINTPGAYMVEIEGINQCVANDIVLVDPLVYPQIIVSSDTFTCNHVQATLMLQVDDPLATVAWEDMNGDTFSLAQSVMVGGSGPFVASVSGLNACETRDTIVVPYDTLAPSAVISVIGGVRCKDRDAMLDGSSSFPQALLYSWSTTTGMIESDPSQPIVDVRDTGLYTLRVELIRNGCADTAQFVLMEHPDAITDAVLDVQSPECSGDENGLISVSSIEGGIAPFLYQLDGGSLHASPIFTELTAGTYVMTILDAANCAFDTTVVIDPAAAFQVDAGPDLEIYIGESIDLSGTTNLLLNLVQQDHWASLGNVLCMNCPEFNVSPVETTTYQYSVTSSTGCTLTDDMILYVQEHGKYYIPNVFSPNGDGINDEVRITASPGIMLVTQWIIFDRWGNTVFGKTNFDPTDASVYWNGHTTTGEFTNPGVFPYLIEIQLINGKVELYHGDITVIR